MDSPFAPDDDCGYAYAGAGYPSGLSIGAGYGLPLPVDKPIKPKPTKSYVAGGFGYMVPSVPQALSWVTDDLTRQFGPAVYDAMDTDPYVGATFRLLKMAVLAAGIKVVPAVEPTPDKSHPSLAGEQTPDEKLAREVADYVERCVGLCKTPFRTVMSEMLEAAKYGNKLAEKTAMLGEEGTEDAGQIVLRDIKVKPRWAWLFVVDVFWEVLGVFCYDPTAGGYIVVPRDKFFVLTWQMRDNDPRGTSLYRQGYRAWNVKQVLYPQYHKHLAQFGTPKVTATTAENEEANQGFGTPVMPVQPSYPSPPFLNGGLAFDVPPTFASAVPTIQTAQERMVQVLEQWDNGKIAAFPFGAEVTVHWPQGDPKAWPTAFDFFNREMVYGILGSTRDSLEAEHGSRADSDTSQDKTGNLIREMRDWLSEGVKRDVFSWLVSARYGKDVAARLCPKADLGEVEHHDIVALMNGVANLLKAKGIDRESQMDGINAMLDLPPAAPGAYAKMAADEQAAAMKSAKAEGEAGADKPGKPKDAA